MKQIDVGIIGTGWCGGIRAHTCAANPLVKSLHLAEIRPERLAEVAKATAARTAVSDYRQLLAIAEIEAIYISATPETTHYPMARDCLAAGKHVFLEKPVALELSEADELIALARERKLKFTIGYSQRFNPKFAYVRKSIRTSPATSARKSAAASSCRPPRWKRPTTWTLCCGVWSRQSPYGSTRRSTSARCARPPVRLFRTPSGSR